MTLAAVRDKNSIMIDGEGLAPLAIARSRMYIVRITCISALQRLFRNQHMNGSTAVAVLCEH